MAIQFLKGTSASYHAPGFTPVADVFYYLTDTHDFYVGTRKLSNDEDLAAAIANIAQNAADITEINTKIAKINQDLAKKVEAELTSVSGKSLVFNETDGGGAKFEHADGTWSYVGVNDGGKNGVTGQLYSGIYENGALTGTRINMTNSGFFYTTGKSNMSYDALDELATKRDVAGASGDASSKTVYVTETAGLSGDPFSKRYGVYQGANGSSSSPVPAEKLVDIDIPKDMVVESGTVGTVTTADIPYPGAQVGDKYIDLVIANATSDHIYIPANSLVDVYTAQPNATQIQLTIDNNNEISAVIVNGSVNTAALADGAVTGAKLSNDAKSLFDDAGAAAAVLGTASDPAGTASVYGALAAAEAAVLTWGAFGE